MNKLLTLFFFLACQSTLLSAQPANDDCAGLIDLGAAPACLDSMFFTNVNATASDIGAGSIPSCFNGGNVERDVWFAFTSSDTIFDYTITVTGIPFGASAAITNPQIALYRGDCTVNGLAELACASAEPGAAAVALNVESLTPNITYFLRINDYTSSLTPHWGTFQLCVEEKQPDNNIDEGGSTACSGVLYDSGGPDGDYSNNENHTFTICPDQPHDCILFSLEYYFIEPQDMFGVTDQLVFYDDAQPNPAAIIGQIGSFNFEDDGGGGVCYQVKANSGCLTVQFTSDAQATFEGFRGFWECTTDCETALPISVDANISDAQVIDFVSTPATTASITNIDCPPGAYGTFQSDVPSGLGLERGLLLTTGSLAWAAGPNTDPGNGTFDSDNNGPGDSELDYLSQLNGNNFLSENACIVELDVFAATNELTFEYVFGSEEYQEYVGLEYNDIFAFLVSGPGITGDPNINNQANIAVLPNGMGTQVEINNVNQLVNWEYYRNNNNGVATQYDGLTSDLLGVKKSLTARAAVQPCNTYHLKFAIADRGDAFFDSGVFISELKGGTPQLAVHFNSGIDYLVEDCGNAPDELTISLTASSSDTISYQLEIAGTATPGVDFTLDVPGSIVFLPGETSFSFPITALSDLESEPTETITIRLTNDFGCGEVVYSELQINLVDELKVDINTGRDTAYICQDNTITLHATGANSYFWSPVSIFNNPTAADPIADPDGSQWVTVEGSLGPCVAYDSIFLQRTTPTIEVQSLNPTEICRGDSVRLAAINNVSGLGLQWAPPFGLDAPNSENPVATPQESITYVASIDITGCVARDSITLNVSAFDFPTVTADTTICENYGVQLADVIPPDSTTTHFQWIPSAGLPSDTIAGPLAFPDVSTRYQLIGTAANGACADTAEVTVTVLPADVNITNPDTVEICLGAAVELSASTTGGGADGLGWSPDDGSLDDTSGLAVTATPDVSTWYFTTYQRGACTVFDSVFIRVDSLPALSITAEPDKEAYCQGEIVQLLSPTYEPAFYPAIQHFWTPSVGFETSDSLWNMVIHVQDTILYQRLAINRGCRDTAEILINVIEPPLISLNPQDTAVCLGEPVRFQLEITGAYEEIEWMGDGLSCTDCLSPAATPAATETYHVIITADGCEPMVGASITVAAPPLILLNDRNVICEGASLLLNLAADSSSTYTWTSTDPDFGTFVGPQPVVSPEETTTYFLLAENSLCPPEEATLTVEVTQAGNLQIEGPLSVCAGDSILLSASVTGGASQEQYLWEGSDGSSQFGASVAFSPTASLTYTLTYISGIGCDTLTARLDVDVQPGVEASLETDSPTGQQGASIGLTASSNRPSPIHFTWTLNQQPIQQGVDLSAYEDILITDPSVYTVFVQDPATGCTDSATLTIRVEPPVIEVPNTFTPNGDGNNDFFSYVILGNVRRVLEFKVFNRWGQPVFDGNSMNPDEFTGWDGTFKGQPQPSEAYFYLLRLERYDGVVEERQGDVSLLR
ncbi:MAG: choice-of-anchor L domain-containing protein [Lewinellaceae bacterium]|nr:choice-of-anchor L domain-containing protein [Phaeodactylibacter sp.]MCB9349520.1 choice-of-anchor L domain-containing protein [Lewinellaceae bacterium]